MTSQNRFIYFFKQKRKIILTGLGAGLILAAGYLAFLYTPVYNCASRIYIRNVPKDNVITEYGDNGAVHSESGYSNPLFNYREMLTSEALATRTYKILEQRYPDDLKKMGIHSKNDWLNKFEKQMKTKVIPSTDIIKINFKWNNKKTACEVFNIILAEFKSLNLDIRKQNEVVSSKYLDEQLFRINDELDMIRAQIKSYRQNNRAIDLVNESEELTRARVELEKQAQLLHSQAAFSSAKLYDFSKQLGMNNTQTALRAVGVGNDPVLIELNQNLALAQQNYAKLKAKFRDAYPAVQEARKQVDSLKASIEQRTRETLGTSSPERQIYDPSSATIVTDMARSHADKASVTAQMQALEQGISKLQQQERALPLKQLGLDMLLKKERSLALAYEQISIKQMEAHLKANMIVDNIVVLSMPSEPSWAFSDLLIKLFALVMLSTVTSLAVAWIKYDLEDQWSELSEIETVTGKKVLGSLPWIKTEELQAIDSYFVPPKSLAGLAYGNIANALIARSYIEDVQTISFIATGISRKGSPIVHNLAATLTRLGKSVLVIDTDFENPGRLLTAMNLQSYNQKDLVSLISEMQSKLRMTKQLDPVSVEHAIRQTVTPIPCQQNEDELSFDYMTADTSNNSVHELLAMPVFKAILDRLKTQYEFILLDSPSKPLIYPEMQTIANVSDSVVLLSSMQSSRQDLLKAIGHLDKNGSKLLGIIPRETNNELTKYISKDLQSQLPSRALKLKAGLQSS